MPEDRKKAARGRLKKVVAGAAPKLAEALGGPLAGAAVAALSKAVFGDDGADEQTVEAALKTAGPEEAAVIRRAELEFAAAVRNAAVEETRLSTADRADARARERALRDWAPSTLGALIIAGFFVVLAAMVTKALPAGAETEFSIMLGALATMTAAVVNYFFGSSAGSKEKTRLIAMSGKLTDDD